MAIVPATITVNFTSNYTGNHRVCYRLGGVGAYDCTTIVTCLGGSSPCSASISVLVDDAVCTDYVYDGYVQATCEDEGSLIGRVAWTATYTPTNACKSLRFTCTGDGSAYCPGFELVTTDCGGATVIVPTVADGGVFSVCFPNGASISTPTKYTVTEAPTDCCTCYTITFSCPLLATGGTYFYQDCTTKAYTSGTMSPGDPDVVVCAIQGTAQVQYNSGITRAIGAACPIT